MIHASDVISDYQATNEEGISVTFTEEAFNKFISHYNTDVKVATIKGTVIGAASVGLVGLSVWGISKLRKRNLKDKKKNEEVEELLEKVDEALEEAEEVEVEIIDKVKPEGTEKIPSRKDREALKTVITEISDAEKKKNKNRKK